MKSKKQRKADKAFIKKIGSLTMGGKAVVGKIKWRLSGLWQERQSHAQIKYHLRPGHEMVRA